MEGVEEEDGDGVSLKIASVLKNLAASTSLTSVDHIEQHLLKEPSQDSGFGYQAWEDGAGIIICLKILEQVVVARCQDFDLQVDNYFRLFTAALMNSRVVQRSCRLSGWWHQLRYQTLLYG